MEKYSVLIWIAKINVKICRFNTIPIKIPVALYRHGKDDLEIPLEKVWQSHFQISELNYNASVTKRV